MFASLFDRLGSSQLAANDHLAGSIKAVHLDNRLRNVETDCRVEKDSCVVIKVEDTGPDRAKHGSNFRIDLPKYWRRGHDG
jgi:hypothetical protein